VAPAGRSRLCRSVFYLSYILFVTDWSQAGKYSTSPVRARRLERSGESGAGACAILVRGLSASFQLRSSMQQNRGRMPGQGALRMRGSPGQRGGGAGAAGCSLQSFGIRFHGLHIGGRYLFCKSFFTTRVRFFLPSAGGKVVPVWLRITRSAGPCHSSPAGPMKKGPSPAECGSFPWHA
jgi:hypothetical protein